MNVEVFVNNNCIINVVVPEKEASEIAARLYDEYKIGLLQMVGVPAAIYISGVRSKIGGPEITEINK